MEDTLKEKLYRQIATELEFCDESQTPLLCYNYSQPDMKENLIETIAETVISMKVPINEALVIVEQTYSMNTTES
jgi:hypothetical protein